MRSALVVFLLSGCSVALQSHLPDGTEYVDAKPVCSRSRALPLVDFALTAGELGTGVAGAVHAGTAGATIAGTALLVGIVQLASGANGLHRATECREVTRRTSVAKR